MAKIISNPIVQGLSGGLGDQLMFRRLKDGRTILCVKPDFSKRKFSKGQKTHQSRFKQAAAYAREAARTQPIYAKLAKGTMKTAYNIALSDWFNPPVIHRIERTKTHIRIKATDNIKVNEVRVSILGEGEVILEAGNAHQVNDLWWEYAAEKMGTIEVQAKDLAGNTAHDLVPDKDSQSKS
jgi:hypothetical protein